MSACIVGVGEPMAGDDAVGIRVVERLRAEVALPPIDLFALRDPSELAELLPGRTRALVIDARLEPELLGRVDLFELDGVAAGRLLDRSARSLSSHGIDTMTAIELGRTLAKAGQFPSVTLLTIAIARPLALQNGLSARAAVAVEEATKRALAWAKESADA